MADRTPNNGILEQCQMYVLGILGIRLLKVNIYYLFLLKLTAIII